MLVIYGMIEAAASIIPNLSLFGSYWFRHLGILS